MGSVTASLFSFLIFSKSPNNWRLLVVAVNSQSILSIILGYYQKESIKFLLNNQLFNQAFSNIDSALTQNEHNKLLSDYEKQQLISYYSEQGTPVSSGYSELFLPQFRHNMFFMACQWFSVILLYYAIIFIIPLRLSQQDIPVSTQQSMILFSNIFEVIVILSLIFLIYHNFCKPKYFFRVIYLLIILCLMTGLALPGLQMPTLLLSRGLSVGIGDLIFVTTDELFPSYMKSRCFGFLSFIGKLGAMVMPLILFTLLRVGFEYLIGYLVLHCLVFGVLELLVRYEPGPAKRMVEIQLI